MIVTAITSMKQTEPKMEQYKRLSSRTVLLDKRFAKCICRCHAKYKLPSSFFLVLVVLIFCWAVQLGKWHVNQLTPFRFHSIVARFSFPLAWSPKQRWPFDCKTREHVTWLLSHAYQTKHNSLLTSFVRDLSQWIQVLLLTYRSLLKCFALALYSPGTFTFNFTFAKILRDFLTKPLLFLSRSLNTHVIKYSFVESFDERFSIDYI